MMRLVSTKTTPFGTRMMMLVDNAQDDNYKGGVLCFMYDDNQDGPSAGAHFYDGWTVDQVILELAESCDRNAEDWKTIPDQDPGCEDDWVEPVRAVHDERGRRLKGVWEKKVNDEWVRFNR